MTTAPGFESKTRRAKTWAVPTKLLFVYGTLKTGMEHWTEYLAPQIGRPATVAGFVLHDGGGSPLAEYATADQVVVGELFNVTQEQLKAIDLLESWCFRVHVRTTENESAYIHLAERIPASAQIIVGGEWRGLKAGTK